jgi:hypothetical protein
MNPGGGILQPHRRENLTSYIFHLSVTLKPAPKPAQLVPEAVLLAVNLTGREADHLPRMLALTPSCVVMACWFTGLHTRCAVRKALHDARWPAGGRAGGCSEQLEQ